MKKSVLYIANYQSPAIRIKRAISSNVSLAGSEKISAITRALEKLGYEVEIFSSGKTGKRDGKYHSAALERMPTCNNSNVHYSPYLAITGVGEIFGLSWFTLKIMRVMMTRPISAVFLYNLNLEALIAGGLAYMLRIPSVLQYEDAVTEYRVPPNGLKVKSGLRILEWWAQSFCDAVIAPNWGNISRIAPRKAMILEGTLPDPIEIQSSENLPEQGDYIFYGGGLDESKGVDRLMRAMDELNYPLVITGSGPLEQKVLEWVKEKPEMRKFLGVLPRQEFLTIVSQAAVCINPHRISWHNNGLWPFKLVEYLGCCGAVLSTPMGSADHRLMRRMVVSADDSSESLALAIRYFFSHSAEISFNRTGNREWAQRIWGIEGVAKDLAGMLDAVKSTEADQRFSQI